MSSIILSSAVALNLADPFMRGERPGTAALEHPMAHVAWAKMTNMQQMKPHLERYDGVFHKPMSRAAFSGASASSKNWSGSGYRRLPGTVANGNAAMSLLLPGTSDAFGSCNNRGGGTRSPRM